MGGRSGSLIRIIFMVLLINPGLMSTYNTSKECMVLFFQKSNDSNVHFPQPGQQ